MLTGLQIKKLIYKIAKYRIVDIIYLKPNAYKALCYYFIELISIFDKTPQEKTRELIDCKNEVKVFNIIIRPTNYYKDIK